MADVIIIRPISDSWPGEAYVRHLSIPHGPLVLAAHLIDKGHTVKIIDEIALEEIVKDNVSDLAKNQLIVDNLNFTTAFMWTGSSPSSTSV